MLSEAIFNIQTEQEFEKIAIQIFQYQYIHNPIYQRFCNLMGRSRTSVKKYEDIPYLPIHFFKQDTVLSSTDAIQQIFTSSGTTRSMVSKHFVTDLGMYRKSFRKGFQYFYGDIKKYTILALLPSYLEKKGSSLIYMVDQLIKDSEQPEDGFYLYENEKLMHQLQLLVKQRKKILLIGVTFALLDLVENYQIQLPEDAIIMETGGMKGRRKEMIRSDVHEVLKKGFGISHIHSEYGMTELLSQAYSEKRGVFKAPPWMRITIRDTEDALTILSAQKTGGINVADLANVNSCSFIATQDLGKMHIDKSFEILGRFDHSDIRGCNLMAL